MPQSHHSLKCAAVVSIRTARYQPVPPTIPLARANKYHTGACITSASARTNATRLRRTQRIWCRSHQKPNANMPSTSVMRAPPEEAVIAMMHALMLPTSASIFPFVLWNHRPMKRGSEVAPKVPASMGCRKAAWHRRCPSRSPVNSGTPPNTEKTLREVNFSRIISKATGTTSSARNFTESMKVFESLIQQETRK